MLRAFPTKCLEGTKSPHRLLWCYGRNSTSTLGTFWLHFWDRYTQRAALFSLSKTVLGWRGIMTPHKSLCAGFSAGFLHFSALRGSLTFLVRTEMGLVGDIAVTEPVTSHWKGLSASAPAPTAQVVSRPSQEASVPYHQAFTSGVNMQSSYIDNPRTTHPDFTFHCPWNGRELYLFQLRILFLQSLDSNSRNKL